MAAVKLSAQQKQAVGSHLGHFRSYLVGKEYVSELSERARQGVEEAAEGAEQGELLEE